MFYRNQQGDIVFLSYDDLQKFSIKFKNFKDNYHKNEQIRWDAIEKLKLAYTES